MFLGPLDVQGKLCSARPAIDFSPQGLKAPADDAPEGSAWLVASRRWQHPRGSHGRRDVDIDLDIDIYLYTHIYICIHVYLQRERDTYMYIYTYIYVGIQ